MSIRAGQYITDGTATFIIIDTRDGGDAGEIKFRPYLKDGYILANGAEVKGEDYPRLVRLAKEYDTAYLSYDEDSDTLTLPNLVDKFIGGGDAVAYKEAGLPNITGRLHVARLGDTDVSQSIPWLDGAIRTGTQDNSNTGYSISTSANSSKQVLHNADIDASLSNAIYGNADTVQPPSLTLLPQIKY